MGGRELRAARGLLHRRLLPGRAGSRGKGRQRRPRVRRAPAPYREVQVLANRFANVFAALGLEPEQRVLIALPDSPEFVGALFGAFKAGAVAVMANPASKPDEIAYFLDYTRARLAVVHVDRLEAWAAAAAGSRWLKRLCSWWASDARGATPPGTRESPRALRPLRERPHAPRRRLPLALLGRHHGPAQGRGPDPPFLRQHHRALRQGHPRLSRVGRDALGAQALLRLRHGLEPLLSVLGGRDRGPLSRAPDARGRCSSRSAATGPPSSSTCRPW